MEDNTKERQKIVSEDVSLDQLESIQIKQNDKHTKKTGFIILAVLLAIGVCLVFQRVFFSNNSTEDNSAYKNKGLNKLRNLDQIQEKERSAFIKSLPEGTSFRQWDIIYDNDKYIDRFGMDEFDKYDKATRDRQYKESIVRQAAYDQFGEDTGLIEWLNGLELQEKIEFLETNCQASYNFENEWQEVVFDSRAYDFDSYDWYSIEDYTIPIPKTMYLNGDTSCNFKYQFIQKDLSKHSSILVSCHYGDYSWMANFLNGQKRHYINEDLEIAHLRETVEFRASFKDEARQMAAYSQMKGMIMSNSKGPDFIDVGGQIVLHAEFEQTAVSPVNHVDTYSFYSPTTYMTVTTNYPVTETKEWKEALKGVIRGMRRIK